MEHFLFFLKLIFYIWTNRNWIEKFPIQWRVIPFKIFFRLKYDFSLEISRLFKSRQQQGSDKSEWCEWCIAKKSCQNCAKIWKANFYRSAIIDATRTTHNLAQRQHFNSRNEDFAHVLFPYMRNKLCSQWLLSCI